MTGVSSRPTVGALITHAHPVLWKVQGRGVMTVGAHTCIMEILLAPHSPWPEWIWAWVPQLHQ